MIHFSKAEKGGPAIKFLGLPKRISSWKISKGLQINNNGRSSAKLLEGYSAVTGIERACCNVFLPDSLNRKA